MYKMYHPPYIRLSEYPFNGVKKPVEDLLDVTLLPEPPEVVR